MLYRFWQEAEGCFRVSNWDGTILNDSTGLYPILVLTAIPLNYLPNPLESGDLSHKGYSDIRCGRAWEPSSFSIQVPRQFSPGYGSW